MPVDQSNTGNESIRGFLQRFVPSFMRPRSTAYGDGFQQENVAPGFQRNYPILFPQQNGPSRFTPLTPLLSTFIPPPVIVYDPPPGDEDPPDDDPPDDPNNPLIPNRPIDPEPAPSGSDSGPEVPSGSGSGSGTDCPFYYAAIDCDYGSGEPLCGVGSGIEVFVCADILCAGTGAGSGGGTGVPIEGQVFVYLGRCYHVTSATEYYRESPPPGGATLPDNAAVVGDDELQCAESCLDGACIREDVYFEATECEPCVAGGDMPLLCGADWAEVVGELGTPRFFKWMGRCFYVDINSRPLSAAGVGQVLIDSGDFEGEYVSCCECCAACAFATGRTPAAIDEPCRPEQDCCCGKVYTVKVVVSIEVVDYAVVPCEDGTCMNLVTTRRQLEGAITVRLEHQLGSQVTIENSLSLRTIAYTIDSACNSSVGSDTTDSVSDPGITISGCSVQVVGLWPTVLPRPYLWDALACVCTVDGYSIFGVLADGTANNSVVISPTLGPSCTNIIFVSDLASLQPICFPGEAEEYENWVSSISAASTCAGGSVTFSENVRGYSTAACPTGCYGIYTLSSSTGSMTWTVVSIESCADESAVGPGTGDYL